MHGKGAAEDFAGGNGFIRGDGFYNAAKSADGAGGLVCDRAMIRVLAQLYLSSGAAALMIILSGVK